MKNIEERAEHKPFALIWLARADGQAIAIDPTAVVLVEPAEEAGSVVSLHSGVRVALKDEPGEVVWSLRHKPMGAFGRQADAYRAPASMRAKSAAG